MARKKGNAALAFAFGAMVGATVGASLAVLLAPVAGNRTRDMLVSRTNETCEGLLRRMVEVKQMAEDLAGDLKEDLGEWAGRTREKLGNRPTEMSPN
ncbi:MAG: YtxH domain-containing protein [Candidatus Xenobia bacterium]